jgi:hypothetical protein
MNASPRPSAVIATPVFLVVILTLAHLVISVAIAQQHRQTDLEFTRERAQVDAAEQEINRLGQRLTNVAAGAAPTSAQEHVLLGREVPSSQTPGASNTSVIRADEAEREAETRIPSTIRHRDRAMTAEEHEALSRRLHNAQKSARALGERVNRPEFDAELQTLEREIAQIEAQISRFE